MPTREKPILAGVTYKSKTELLDFVKNLLEKRGECLIKSSDNDFIFFKDLYARNPKHKNHLDKVNGFKICKDSTSELTNKVFCIDMNGTEHLFGWRACVDGKGSDNSERLMDAFREAINQQITEFSRNKECCELCGGNSGKFEVDHIIEFIDLVNKFKMNMNMPDKFEKNHIGQNCFRPEDISFKDKWTDYHKKNATLQYLCKECHDKKTYKR